MMKMNRNKMMIGLALLTLGVVSCKETDIEFNQEQYDAALKAAFPVQNVDPTHTWTTVGTGKAVVKVNLTSSGASEMFNYFIYKENPLYSENVTLLASGSVQNGNSFYTTFNYEVNSSNVFIALEDQSGRMTVYPREITDGMIDTSIGGQTSAATAGAAQPEENTTQAPRRVIKNNVTFPDAPAASNFKTTNGATERCGEYSYGTLFYIDSNNNGKKVQPYLNWDDSRTIEIYVVGEVSPSSFSIPKNTTVYILPNAKLILSDGYEFGQGNQVVYIADGGELTVQDSNGNLGTLNVGWDGKMYNRGTLKAANINIKSTGFIYNEAPITTTDIDITNDGGRLVNKSTISARNLGCNGGVLNEKTITLTGNLNITAGTSYFENDDTFTAVDMIMAGGSKAYNYGLVNMSGNVQTSSQNDTWDNQGTFYCKKFRRTGGWSENIINRCKLVASDSIVISGSSTAAFKNEGYVETPNLYLTTSRVTLASSSVFKVTKCAHFGYNNYNQWSMPNSLGFQSIATESNKALLIMNKATRDTNFASFNISYWGPMVVACPDHFDYSTGFTSNDGDASHPQVCIKDGAVFTNDPTKTTVVIPTSQCVEGHDGSEVKIPSEDKVSPLSLRYCFEDNFPSPGDYDFNDVVLTVTPTVSGKVLTVNVSLDAVGASNCLAAAIRVIGAGTAEAAVVEGFAKPRSNFGTYANITTDEDFVTKGSDKVIILFKDAHWAMNNTESGLYSGSPKRIFYNTVKDRNSSKGMVVPKATAQYTLTFATEEQAQTAAAENKFDVFIINPSGFEIHTVQNNFKLSTVLKTLPNMDAYNIAYKDNMPWAIMLPHTSANPFKYPVEWTPIGGNKGYVATGAYQFSNASFAEWATNSESSNDWYKHPEEDLVYDE